MRDNIDECLQIVFGEEGGYVNVRTDRGGPTKYGITHRTLARSRGVKSVNAAAVKAMTIEEAEAIYRRSYWGPSGGDVLPVGLDLAAFDFSVNSGPKTAVKKLQDVLKKGGVYAGTIDGWIGEGTLNGITKYTGGVGQLIKDYCARRMAYLRRLTSKKTGFPVNGRGWTIRVTGIDPRGTWAPEPGIVGNALAMWNEDRSKIKVATRGGSASASAEAQPKNALISKEVLAMGGAAATAGGTILSSGIDPLKLAIAAVVIGTFALAAWVVIRRYKLLDPADAL